MNEPLTTLTPLVTLPPNVEAWLSKPRASIVIEHVLPCVFRAMAHHPSVSDIAIDGTSSKDAIASLDLKLSQFNKEE